MTIASDLVSINTTKQNIKTAIEAKGVTVGAVPFADYPDKIADITTGGGGGFTEWTQAYYDSVKATADAAVTASAWSRPADWLAMPSVTATDQKFVGLHPVFNNDSNWAVVRATGAYTVDWGDGVTENYASNAIATHNYVYADISDTTTSTRSYRQVLVTVTPQAGQTLSSIDLQANPANAAIPRVNNWLDIVVAMNNSGQLLLSGGAAASRLCRMLERFRWIGSNLNPTSSFFSGCIRLREVELDTSSQNNFSSMFSGCTDLTTIPLIDTSNGTDFSSMFSGCTSLITIPLINVSKGTTYQNMFNGCVNLITVPLLDISNAIATSKSTTAYTNMFVACNSLKTIPALNFSRAPGLATTFQNCRDLEFMPAITASAATTFSSTFNGCFNLKTVGAITATSATTFSSMFQACYTLETVGDITTSTALTTLSAMFQDCHQIKTIPAISVVSNVTAISSMCQNCFSLVSFPNFVMPSVTNTQNMFNACTSLISVPALGGTSLTTATGMFLNCTNLKSITLTCAGGMNTLFSGCAELQSVSITNSSNSQTIDATSMFSGCTSITDIALNLTGGGLIASALPTTFNNCYNLKTISGFSVNNATTTATNTFLNCVNLSSVTLPGMVATFSVTTCSLSRTALVALFNSLGTASGRTITITNNWGAADLTAGERAIATGKGFTIVG